MIQIQSPTLHVAKSLAKSVLAAAATVLLSCNTSATLYYEFEVLDLPANYSVAEQLTAELNGNNITFYNAKGGLPLAYEASSIAGIYFFNLDYVPVAVNVSGSSSGVSFSPGTSGWGTVAGFTPVAGLRADNPGPSKGINPLEWLTVTLDGPGGDFAGFTWEETFGIADQSIGLHVIAEGAPADSDKYLIFKSSQDISVPEAASTIMLLGAALTSMNVLRRRLNRA